MSRSAFAGIGVLIALILIEPLARPIVTRLAAAQISKASDDAESKKKAQILASDRWKKVVQEFDQWLAVQVVYTPEQVAQIKAKLAAQVQTMSASELEEFLNQWDAKLKVLLGKDAAEAREWLAQNLQVMADGYRKQFLKQLGITDVTKMTAAQIEEAMERMRADRLALVQQREVFDASRQQQVRMAQEMEAASNTARQDAANNQAAQYPTYQSQYSPRRYDYAPRPPLLPVFWW